MSLFSLMKITDMNFSYKRLFPIVIISLVSFLIGACQNKQRRPNIVFILADDLGWSDLPVYGNQFNEAPNIDKLAKEGMQFTNAYATCPVCSPSRASIMSGQYPARLGINDFITGHWRPNEEVIVPVNRSQYLPGEIITISEVLKESGYATGYFGKWHLGFGEEYHPSTQGFDQANVGSKYYNAKFTPPRAEGSTKRLSEILTDFGEEFIEENKEKPFFLFLSHYDVHVQLDADMDLIDKYQKKQAVDGYPSNAVYAAMIEHLDRSVERIQNKLNELDLAENTILIFFSDNGGLSKRFDQIPLLAKSKQHLYENDTLLFIATSNSPLRNEKGTVYEGGIRVPLIVKWPNEIKPGTVSNAVVTGVDFFPTLAKLAGATLPANQTVDGQPIDFHLDDKDAVEQRSVFWHYPVYHHDEPKSAVRRGDWKLVQNLVNNRYELYNLSSDIGEQNDLSASEPEKVKLLAAELYNWQDGIKAMLPVPNPDFNIETRYKWGKHPDRK